MRIVEVRPGKAVIEFPLSGAVGRFVWTFEQIAGSTRITQRCTLQGEQAEAYAEAVGPGLQTGLSAGPTPAARTRHAAFALQSRERWNRDRRSFADQMDC